MTFAPTCFDSHRNHPQGAVQYLAKNYKYDSTVFVGMHLINVHELLRYLITVVVKYYSDTTVSEKVNPFHDYVHADEHSRTISVVFSQALDSSLRMVPV
jgi:hypothetical protein